MEAVATVAADTASRRLSGRIGGDAITIALGCLHGELRGRAGLRDVLVGLLAHHQNIVEGGLGASRNEGTRSTRLTLIPRPAPCSTSVSQTPIHGIHKIGAQPLAAHRLRILRSDFGPRHQNGIKITACQHANRAGDK